MEFNKGNLVINKENNRIQPLVTITCKECGNTVLINPLVLDLLSK